MREPEAKPAGERQNRAWPSERSRDGGVDEVPIDGVPGRLFLCGKHAVGPDPDALLERIGGDAVVCLNETYELAERYPEFVAWLGEHAAAARAVHHPIPDLHAPALDDFAALIDSLYARLAAGETLVVNCGAGIGRTGTVAVGLLVRDGVALGDALRILRAHRPMAGPEVGAQSDVLKAYASSRVRSATDVELLQDRRTAGPDR